jgi:hypothetical protein
MRSNPQSDGGALEVAGAGLALACTYSSSDEYEAAIIAERRAAGAYAPKRSVHPLWLAVAIAVTALALTFSF